MNRFIWQGETSPQVLFAAFLFTTAIAPAAIFWGVFRIFLSVEATVLPWFTLIAAPAVIAATVVPLAIYLGIKIFQRSASLKRFGTTLKIAIVLSILWAPLLASQVFALTFSLMQVAH